MLHKEAEHALDLAPLKCKHNVLPFVKHVFYVWCENVLTQYLQKDPTIFTLSRSFQYFIPSKYFSQPC